jgi:hypothetical protein
MKSFQNDLTLAVTNRAPLKNVTNNAGYHLRSSIVDPSSSAHNSIPLRHVTIENREPKETVQADGVVETIFGTRCIRKAFIPPLSENSPLPSCNPRIQKEIAKLRSQKKVGGIPITVEQHEEVSLA